MQEVYKDIYQIEVPLPRNPLKVLNSYVIKGPRRNLLIDTGFNLPECEASLFGGLQELNIDLNQTDVFITHVHSDHSGLACKLKTPGNKIMISPTDGAMLSRDDESYWDNLMVLQISMGFPEDKMISKYDHPGYAHGMKEAVDFTLVQAGEKLAIGDYCLEIMDFKGHSPGQLGIFDWEKGILFSGDHVLSKITPNIGFWDLAEDYLGAFLDNLRRIKDLPVKLILPAHRKIIEDPGVRVDELLDHHARRLDAILNILKQKNSTMYELASGIPWDFAGGQFLGFPPTQQWFAASEVYAHMEYLEKLGQVKKRVRADGVYVYEIIK